MISIALASYNGSKYISEQLDSILSQTFQDFELIICDDCSTDNTMQLLNEYASKDSRIKVYRNEKNLGFKKNFEKAISLCNGEYIALSDQDDIWMKNHLEVLFHNIDGKVASSGNALMIDGYGMEKKYTLSEGDCYYVDGNDIDKLFAILCNRNPFFGAISLYKKELLDIAMPIPDSVKYHDAWFAAIACCTGGLSYSFEPLIKHRIHGDNETGSHFNTFPQRILKAFNTRNSNILFNQKKNMCDALISRIPNMIDAKKESVNLISEYYKNRFCSKRLKTISFIKQHYKQIYSTSNNHGLFVRCMKILMFG